MLVLLLEPACKCCWTRCLGGKHGLFQAVLFAGGPKGPSKKPTEMMPWRAGLLPLMVTDQQKQHGAKGGVKEGKEEPPEYKATNGRSLFPPVLHMKWLHTCHHNQTPLHGRITASFLEAMEDFRILHHKAHTSPLVLSTFSTGDSDLLWRSHNHCPTSFCTTWFSRLNPGSSTSLFAVVHKPLYCSFEPTPSHHLT